MIPPRLRWALYLPSQSPQFVALLDKLEDAAKAHEKAERAQERVEIQVERSITKAWTPVEIHKARMIDQFGGDAVARGDYPPIPPKKMKR